MCDVSLIARKSFVLRVNKVTSPHQTHDRQSAARVPTGVLKLAFMEHTSQRLFITYVFFLTVGHGPAERHHQLDSICFLMVTLRARDIKSETFDEGMQFSESTRKSHTWTYVRRA